MIPANFGIKHECAKFRKAVLSKNKEFKQRLSIWNRTRQQKLYLTLITDNYYNESTSKVYVNKGDMFLNYINNCVHVNQDVNLLIFCILVMGL